MSARAPRFLDALATLAEGQVEFIVVGGVAAVLEGAPISTFDLDIVHARTPDNIDRLLAALRQLEATYRDPGGRRLEPTAEGLVGAGHHLLMTTCGPLDVLGQIGHGSDWAALSTHAVTRALGDLTIHVLGLARQIEIKEETGRPKDVAMLPVLRRALREREQG